MFKFDSNMICRFKDLFYKVKAINIVVDGLPLMHDGNREPCFHFYCQSDPTRFKSFDEDLMTLVDKAIVEKFPTSLDARTILSLPSVDDPLTVLDGKAFYLPFFTLVLA